MIQERTKKILADLYSKNSDVLSVPKKNRDKDKAVNESGIHSHVDSQTIAI